MWQSMDATTSLFMFLMWSNQFRQRKPIIIFKLPYNNPCKSFTHTHNSSGLLHIYLHARNPHVNTKPISVSMQHLSHPIKVAIEWNVHRYDQILVKYFTLTSCWMSGCVRWVKWQRPFPMNVCVCVSIAITNWNIDSRYVRFGKHFFPHICVFISTYMSEGTFAYWPFFHMRSIYSSHLPLWCSVMMSDAIYIALLRSYQLSSIMIHRQTRLRSIFEFMHEPFDNLLLLLSYACGCLLKTNNCNCY